MEQAEQITVELEATRGDLERVKREKADIARELEARDAAIAELKQSLTGKDSEIAILKQTVVESEKKLAETGDVLGKAIASHKALIARANPDIPAELVTGDTIESINQSLENARALVDKVKQGIEAEISKAKVPFGAPRRAPIDLSALSAREKIQYAIGGKK